MDEGVLAAVRRFPERQRAIEALAARDEDFRSLCADLADAKTALGRWEVSPDAVRDERCSEYRAIVDDLGKEIEAVLDAVAGPARPHPEHRDG